MLLKDGFFEEASMLVGIPDNAGASLLDGSVRINRGPTWEEAELVRLKEDVGIAVQAPQHTIDFLNAATRLSDRSSSTIAQAFSRADLSPPEAAVLGGMQARYQRGVEEPGLRGMRIIRHPEGPQAIERVDDLPYYAAQLMLKNLGGTNAADKFFRVGYRGIENTHPATLREIMLAARQVKARFMGAASMTLLARER